MAMSKVSQHLKGSSDVQYLRCVTMINEREEKKSVREVDKRKTGSKWQGLETDDRTVYPG